MIKKSLNDPYFRIDNIILRLNKYLGPVACNAANSELPS